MGKVDVAVLGVVRSGKRTPARGARRAVRPLQALVAAAFTLEVAWLCAWWALAVVVAGTVLITAAQALFSRRAARRVPPGPPRDGGGFRLEGDSESFPCECSGFGEP